MTEETAPSRTPGDISSPAAELVLVVDDDPDLRALVVAVLELGRFRTSQAASGEEALYAVHRERPSAVVLDVRMPGISGYEVCRELRAEYGPGLPIVFLSGSRTDPLDEVAGLLLGADDYLTKPFVPDELLVRLRSLLRRSRVRRIGATGLTPRELQVLRLLADGFAQNDIAEQLVISPKTVGNHIEHILSKLGVRSRSQAIALAYRSDLFG
jgi:DNA-binding NarL/FixJ family response regulator